MTAKEYLLQLQKMDALINQKIQEKSDLRVQLMGISSFDLSKDRVQGSGPFGKCGTAEKIVKLISLEEEIDRDIDAFIDLKHKIINQIHSLQNAEQIKVLYKRYVDFKRFEEIADDMNYSLRSVYRAHGCGLKNFQELFL